MTTSRIAPIYLRILLSRGRWRRDAVAGDYLGGRIVPRSRS